MSRRPEERPAVIPTPSNPQAASDWEDDISTAAHINVDAAIDAGIPLGASSQAVVVDFRAGEAVHLHPSIQPLLDEGWTVQRAVPRLIDGEIKMLVELRRRERLQA
jgi:hypothetical protein